MSDGENEVAPELRAVLFDKDAVFRKHLSQHVEWAHTLAEPGRRLAGRLLEGTFNEVLDLFRSEPEVLQDRVDKETRDQLGKIQAEVFVDNMTAFYLSLVSQLSEHLMPSARSIRDLPNAGPAIEAYEAMLDLARATLHGEAE